MAVECDKCGGPLELVRYTPYDGTPEFECQRCGAEEIGKLA